MKIFFKERMQSMMKSEEYKFINKPFSQSEFATGWLGNERSEDDLAKKY